MENKISSNDLIVIGGVDDPDYMKDQLTNLVDYLMRLSTMKNFDHIKLEVIQERHLKPISGDSESIRHQQIGPMVFSIIIKDFSKSQSLL